MLLFPKPGKRPKKRRKPIPKRSKFQTKSNVFKTFYRRHDPIKTAAFAADCRLKQLGSPTPAGRALAAALRNRCVPFAQEHILHNIVTGAWCIADFWLPRHRTVIELDGAQHRLQRGYDAGRDRFIAEFTGFRVLRFWNAWALKPELDSRLEALGL